MTPMMIAGYDLHEIIYEGSTTTLYRARSCADQQTVILKVLQTEYPERALIHRLQHEHAIVADLNLPHVVKVYRLETQGSRAFLVIEDIGGQSLKQWLAS